MDILMTIVSSFGSNAAPAVCATFALMIPMGLIGSYVACERHDAKLGLTS